PGKMANRESSTPEFSTIHIEKREDISTVGLFRSSVAGSKGKQATLHFVRTGADELIEYMTYTLDNCLISQYLIYDTEFNKRPHEKIQLSFSSILISETARDANNSPVKTVRSGYDLEKAAGL
ncbi:MAG: type VI secretion system tube protein Hcp, partial [Gammaproteobacteria bacterium]|nr:type VI secretion system tube protein Hcp [Gammaproteobacteria bacterium]